MLRRRRRGLRRLLGVVPFPKLTKYKVVIYSNIVMDD